MIIDKLENACFYYNLNAKIEKALRYLQDNDPSEFDNGKYEIDNDNIFVLIQDYDTKTEGKWEAHEKYIDIQYIIKGREKMGYVNIDELKPVTDYDKDKDILFLEGDGNFVIADEGYFVIFAPQDAHMPGIMIDAPEYVKKAVVKIKS
ncbi:MAG: hypothetical protein A2287_00835 [Candidatus Melainabacteria bacterium RIFOXYA12_FULL_32_12]|nr:MAG: hypothetical protein A2255_03710 [Candidatus Melainabacteria bacterium RIFOXYA2_FULL_32_9]OGI24756.1 MAG: hypothetical protein A2287_00835 [Candidatus Melainabacteria bacterium RIFOXYA12_FULL_32_12]